MAINLLTNPASVPGSNSDWTNFVAREDVAGAGGGLLFCTMQLTQRGTTTVPAIEQGGIINVGGSWYQADSDTALTNDPSGLADGTCHIKLVPSGSTVVPTLTNDSIPAWDSQKSGWYDSDDMFLPYEFERSGAVTKVYTGKFQYAINVDKTVKIYDDGAASFDGSMTVGGALTVSSGVSAVGNIVSSATVEGNKISAGSGMVLSNSTSYTFTTVSPGAVLSLGTGLYMIQAQSAGSGAGEMQIEVFDGSSWGGTGLSDPYGGGLFWADGNTSVRLRETTFSQSVNIRYRKLI